MRSDMESDFEGVIGIVYCNKPRQFLLVQNEKTGNITFPSGGREKGETQGIQTLEREIFEETGLAPPKYQVMKTELIHEFTYGDHKKERAGQRVRQLVYLVKTKKWPVVSLDRDIHIAGWFSAEEVLLKLSFSDSKELFKKVITHIKKF